MNSNVVEDVSKLTTVSTKVLNQLMDKFIYCIVDSVKESRLANEDITNVDVAIGVITIQHVGSQLKYRFTPSEKLNKQMHDLFYNKLNSLENVVESTLIEKLTNTYKDLI